MKLVVLLVLFFLLCILILIYQKKFFLGTIITKDHCLGVLVKDQKKSCIIDFLVNLCYTNSSKNSHSIF